MILITSYKDLKNSEKRVYQVSKSTSAHILQGPLLAASSQESQVKPNSATLNSLIETCERRPEGMGFRWERNLGDIINPGYSHKPYRYAIDIPSIGFFFGDMFFLKKHNRWNIYGISMVYGNIQGLWWLNLEFLIFGDMTLKKKWLKS